MKIQGIFDTQRFFDVLAMILSEKEGVKVSVTVTHPEEEKKQTA